MIPKKIHYCWFGHNPLPLLAQKCIASWRKFLPDYDIKEWNEENFDLDFCPYVREAYDSRKYAFVTDVVRLYALYTEGGIYMDTDVEVLKPLDSFLCHTAFSGFEDDHNVPTGIMASIEGGKWVKENLVYYYNRSFFKSDGSIDLTTNVTIITNYMLNHGLKQDNTYQDFPNLVTLYPSDYFCPKSMNKTGIKLTNRTITIHHYAGSWLPFKSRVRKFVRMYTNNYMYRLLRLLIKGKQ